MESWPVDGALCDPVGQHHTGHPNFSIAVGNLHTIYVDIAEARYRAHRLRHLRCGHVLSFPAERVADAVTPVIETLFISGQQISRVEITISFYQNIGEQFLVGRRLIRVPIEARLQYFVVDDVHNQANFVGAGHLAQACGGVTVRLRFVVRLHLEDLERVQGIGDPYRDVAQGSLLAGAVEQIHIALGGRVEFNHPAHVVAALKLVPNVWTHAVADRKVELYFGIGLTKRSVHQVATELADVLHGGAVVLDQVSTERSHRELASDDHGGSRAQHTTHAEHARGTVIQRQASVQPLPGLQIAEYRHGQRAEEEAGVRDLARFRQTGGAGSEDVQERVALLHQVAQCFVGAFNGERTHFLGGFVPEKHLHALAFEFFDLFGQHTSQVSVHHKHLGEGFFHSHVHAV
mmetsp:Transcript_57089/g.100242  ORF Transcript_57089/g.100242 Transcript_57089/m.100242 type:complete len:404 (-) Transcript_57089:498-1709(-)